ncbi:putative cytochrome P450 [Rosa chinensis]|uniref:Putative cytochrome P450 n=1 Tax=Rosa chinensis TaxID=74649 RepID=A0A2P6Q8Z0_ROSCH|nr:beta-amyrin 28-monooxygenase [Rosa chinensis]PRQ30627.1 putative cytochrome P450 [Rosa chinensis]
MEPLYLTIIVIVTTIVLIILTYPKTSSSNHTNLPPGSFGWPILGETLEFLFGKPDKFVEKRMKKHSSLVFKTRILGENVAVFCGPIGNKFIFSNEQKLVTAWRPHSLQKLMRSYQQSDQTSPTPTPTLKPTQNETTVIRTPGFFKPEALARFLGVMDMTTKQQLKTHWEGKSKVQVYPLSKIFTLALASRFFLGIEDYDCVTKLVQEFDDVSLGLHCIPLNFPGTIFNRASKGAAAIRKQIISIIKEKKAAALLSGKPGHDILSYMIASTDSSGKFMPETELADKVMGLLTAGYSTVASALTFVMKFVGERPDIYNKILAEQMEIANSKKPDDTLNWDDIQKMKYSWNVACEAMRFFPPLQGTFREAITDISFEGYTIPKGWKIYWTVSSTNKNPEYFPNPEKFDPTRYEEGSAQVPFTYVPFGGGPRLCPGKEYARLAILTFLHNVVMKFKWEIMLLNEKMIGDMIPTPAQGLPVLLKPH